MATPAEEKAELLEYARTHSIEKMILSFVEAAAVERPADKAAFWYEKLGKELQGEDDSDDDDETPAQTPVATAAIPGGVGGAGGQTAWVNDVPGTSLRNLFEATKRITKEIVPKESIRVLIEETIDLLKCDRVSVFIYDSKIDMLILSASNLAKPIRVARGQGIAGYVFENQEIVNIPDCYKDSRFDPSFDKMSGYHTRCLLVMPILDFEKESVGVLQAINKLDGVFTEQDAMMLQHLAQQAGIAYRNAELYGAALRSSERSAGLLKMLNALTQNVGAQSMILQMTMHANELVRADRCTVFMLDQQKGELWSVSTDTGKEIRIPKSKGIAGECCSQVYTINIEDAYKDARFNPAMDKLSGYHTQSILAVPITPPVVENPGSDVESDDEKEVFGIVQMINKTEFDGQVGVFDEDDINVIETFASLVGAKMAHSSLFKRQQKVQSEAACAFGQTTVSKAGKSRKSMMCVEACVQEGSGDEEEG